MEKQEMLFAKLKELGIPTVTKEHKQCFTAEDVESVAEECGLQPASGRCKNMFLKSKKGDLFCFTTQSASKIDMKLLSKKLGAPECRFAGDEYLASVLQVIKGSVTPFAAINDTENKCTFAIDKDLMKEQTLWLHPLHNDKSTSISADNLVKFLEAVGHPPKILDFSDAEASSSDAAAKPKQAGGADKKAAKGEGQKDVQKETLLSITAKKEEDFANWYSEVITRSDMIDYYDISGCYILKPWSFSIWEQIQTFLDGEIKKLGVQGCYFPMFVSQKALEAEKDHIEGFSPEVAWVTKSGQSELENPIAVRPTSETIMYPAFAKWIRSHRDLPLKLNQWCNVVRWEFKNPTPFIRTREFLWQEGHTAHSSLESAATEVLDILDLYRRVYEELLAVPVVKGKKTETEKFAGGFYTTTVEAFIPATARGIQGATSHNLGQNFGKMFKIEYEDEKGSKQIPWQNSWGMTTRTIGVMVMIHADNQGLVLPPRVAPVQVIVIPVVYKDSAAELNSKAEELVESLRAAGIRVDIDTRSNYTAGWKYNHWEQKGVPIRLELGPKDLEKKQVRMVRRLDNSKEDVPLSVIVPKLKLELELIQHKMLQRAKDEHSTRTRTVMKWEEFVPALDAGCMALTPFCDEAEWEETAKKRSKEEKLSAGETEDERTAVSAAAKTLCIPFDQPDLPAGTPCFISGKPAKCWVLWGRTY